MNKDEMWRRFSLSLTSIQRIQQEFLRFKRTPQKLIRSILINQMIKEFIDNTNNPFKAKITQHEINKSFKVSNSFANN